MTTTHQVVAEAKERAERMSARVMLTGTEEQCEEYVDRNTSPDNSERYHIRPSAPRVRAAAD